MSGIPDTVQNGHFVGEQLDHCHQAGSTNDQRVLQDFQVSGQVPVAQRAGKAECKHNEIESQTGTPGQGRGNGQLGQMGKSGFRQAFGNEGRPLAGQFARGAKRCFEVGLGRDGHD